MAPSLFKHCTNPSNPAAYLAFIALTVSSSINHSTFITHLPCFLPTAAISGFLSSLYSAISQTNLSNSSLQHPSHSISIHPLLSFYLLSQMLPYTDSSPPSKIFDSWKFSVNIQPHRSSALTLTSHTSLFTLFSFLYIYHTSPHLSSAATQSHT